MRRLSKKHFECLDCKKDTTSYADSYMVKDVLWERVVGDGRAGCVCLPCFERRLGRKLKQRDFTDCALNALNGYIPMTKKYALYWAQFV